jgi:hypothetical protein
VADDTCLHRFRRGNDLLSGFEAQGLKSHGNVISTTMSSEDPRGIVDSKRRVNEIKNRTAHNIPSKCGRRRFGPGGPRTVSTPGKRKKDVASRRDA